MSRGVIFGDVHRADKAWNERIGAAGAGAGVETMAYAEPQVMPTASGNMLVADLFDPGEGRSVMMDLVRSYTGCERGTVFEILLSMCGHALSVGVLAERQRWDGEAMVPEGPAEPSRSAPADAIAVITSWLRERDEDHRFDDTLPTEEECAREAASLIGALWDAAAGE